MSLKAVNKFSLLCAVSAAGLSVAAPVVMGQDQKAGWLEEVLVTAQKRVQNQQNVPIALSVISSAELENRSIANFSELFDQVPNTVIDQAIASIPKISIRGVTSNTNNIGIDSGVGVAVDEVFLGRPSMFSTNFIDLERVEVLRGPQGTLFGKNTIGGLINIVTRKPSLEETEGSVDLTLGNDELRQLRGYLSSPLIDKTLAGKLSFTHREQDGWAENRNPAGEDLNGTDFWGVRGQLLGAFGEEGRWLLTGEYSEDDAPENYLDVLSGPLTGFDNDPGDREIETNGGDTFEREIYGYSLVVDWAFGDLDFVSITSARGVDWTGQNDQDYSVVRLFDSGRTEKSDQFSQEFRVSGEADAFTWVAGLYYFEQDQDANGPLILGEDVPPFLGIGEFPGFQESATTVASIDTTSYAAFASGTWAISEKWELTAGARFTQEEKDFNYRQDNAVFELFPGVEINLIGAFFPAVAPVTDDLNDSDWSGDVALSYHVTDQVNTYAKVSRGFKAGGFDSTLSGSSDPGNLQFDAETLLAYEIGLKSQLWDDRIRLNLAAFYYDYEDKQEQFFNGSIFSISNAAEAEITGLELDLTAQATKNLTVGTSLGYQDASYGSYVDPITSADFSDNELPNVPEFTAAAYIEYQHSMNNGWSLFLRTDANYKDSVYLRPSNDSRFEADSYTLVNARVSVSSPGSKYTAAVWLKNATDEDAVLVVQDNPALQTEWVGYNPPRMWGVELRMNF